MKVKLLLLLFAFFFNIAISFAQKNQNYYSFIKLANESYKLKKYKSSVENFEKAFKIYKKDKSDLYNAACSASLNQDLEKAKYFLTVSIENGWNDIEHLYKDSDLFNIHCSKEWKILLKKVEINQKKMLTAEQLSDKVKKIIHTNNTDSIFKLTSNDLKTQNKQKELKGTINTIRQLLRENNIENLYLFRTNSNKSTKWINGIMTQTYSTKHKIIPKYFNGYLPSLLSKPLGYEIKINYTKKENQWFLSELKLINKYADSEYNMVNEINSLFEKSDSLLFAYNLLKNEHKSNNKGSIKTLDMGGLITNELKKSKHLKLSEIKDKMLLENSKVFSLNFHSKKESISSKNPFLKQNKKTTNTLEIVFYDNNSNIILVSNGYKYAFYRINSVEKLKKIVVSKMIEITK